MQNAMNIMNNSYLNVDMHIFKNNVNTIISSLPAEARLIPVLKGDGFGLGLVPLARAAAGFDAISTLAVSHASEGLTLRAGGITKDILVMSAAMPHQLSGAVAAGLILAAPSADFIRALDGAAEGLGLLARVHIKIDTGLHRIGVEPGEELDGLIRALHAARHVRAEGVFSHFADTDDAEACAGQFARFMQAIEQLDAAGISGIMRHIACSAARERYPQYTLDAVRVGRGLIMDSPDGVPHGIGEPASWRSFITAVKHRKKGDTLGYSGAYVLPQDADIATIGVGYGDGLFPELCRRQAPVLIHGVRRPLIACCMDQCFADVSGLGCRVGDEVTLFGSDGAGGFLSSQEVAAYINDEGCALTSALLPRVARRYVDL